MGADSHEIYMRQEAERMAQNRVIEEQRIAGERQQQQQSYYHSPPLNHPPRFRQSEPDTSFRVNWGALLVMAIIAALVLIARYGLSH